ncbi:hypothetical protein TELCIR_08970 [Teladorsagia circumcincta]|uniref:DPH-type MB domain-containing protein n=1 Tax=Teladorsagia circumcincta TaxID=45464 RepID=A0A2G9UGC3_TELCI|nr:hypothetical protein TELCIR_08970 [Teladorsagia circumcincta]
MSLVAKRVTMFMGTEPTLRGSGQRQKKTNETSMKEAKPSQYLVHKVVIAKQHFQKISEFSMWRQWQFSMTKLKLKTSRMMRKMNCTITLALVVIDLKLQMGRVRVLWSNETGREMLEMGEDVATCPSCSLIVRVIYDPDLFTNLETLTTSPPRAMISDTA